MREFERMKSSVDTYHIEEAKRFVEKPPSLV